MNHTTLHALRVVRSLPWQMLGLALLVALVVATLGARARARSMVVETVADAQTRLNAADLEIHFQATWPQDLHEAGDVAGVRTVEARLVTTGVLRHERSPGLPVLVALLPSGGGPSVDCLELLAGRLPAEDEAAVVVDRALRRFNGIEVGDTVTIRVGETDLELPVVGVSLSPEHLVAPVHPDHVLPARGAVGAVSVSAAAARGLKHAERVNVLGVRLAPGARADAVSEAIAARCGLLVNRVQTWRERPGQRYVELLLASFDATSPAVLGVLAVTGALALALTLGRIVRRQRRQFGVLLALGHRPGRIGVSFVGPAVAVALAGAVLGTAAHGVLARVLAGGITADIGFPPLVSGAVPWTLQACTAAACVGVAALAAWLPARAIARASPARALVPTPWDLARPRGAGSRRAGAWLCGALRVPTAAALGFAQALRRRRVTTGAAAGLALAFGTILAYLMLQVGHGEACRDTVASWGRDATVHFEAPVGPDTVEALEALPSATVEPYLSRHGLLAHDGTPCSVRVLGLDPRGLAARLPLARGRALDAAEPEGALVDRWLSTHRALSVGDEIELLPYANAPESRTIRVVGILDGIGFGRVVVPLSTVRELYGMPEMASGAFVSSGRAPDELDAALRRVPSVGGVFLRGRMLAEVGAASGGRAGVIRLAIALGLAYATLFLLIMATLDADERASQIALLLVAGWRDRSLLLLLGAEMGARGGLGLLAGMGMAPLLAAWFSTRIEHATGVTLEPGASAWLFPAVALSALVGMALATLPAWVAALRTSPGAMLVGLQQE